jgi:hypothetical protein
MGARCDTSTIRRRITRAVLSHVLLLLLQSTVSAVFNVLVQTVAATALNVANNVLAAANAGEGGDLGWCSCAIPTLLAHARCAPPQKNPQTQQRGSALLLQVPPASARRCHRCARWRQCQAQVGPAASHHAVAV